MNNQFYNVIDSTKDFLLSGPFTKTVTFGNISDVDLVKTSIFPLAHLLVDNVTFNGPVAAVTLKVMVMDVVDENKNEDDDLFVGNDNTQDILNTQMAVLQRFYTEIRNGSLRQAPFELEDDQMTAEPFSDRFKNLLAGWTCDINLVIHMNTSRTNADGTEC